MVHSSIKYWSGEVTWSLYNSSSPFKAKCADMAITTFINATIKPTSYLIICPYEGKFAADTTIKGTATTLTLASWTWPDYYGKYAFIGAHLRYMWTGKQGNLRAYLAEKRLSTQTNCTIGSASAIYAENTY